MCFTYVAATLVLGSLQDARVRARHVRSRTLPMLFGKYWYFTLLMGKFESGAHFGGTKYRWVGLLLMRFFTLLSSFSVPCMRRNQSL